jgi:hypothetical protein
MMAVEKKPWLPNFYHRFPLIFLLGLKEKCAMVAGHFCNSREEKVVSKMVSSFNFNVQSNILSITYITYSALLGMLLDHHHWCTVRDSRE